MTLPPDSDVAQVDRSASNSADDALERRKRFLQFSERDVATLTRIHEVAARYADAVIDAFYDHLLAFDETRAFLQDPHTLQRVKNLQKEYFLRLTQGNYDATYARNRVAVGTAHERIGLPVRYQCPQADRAAVGAGGEDGGDRQSHRRPRP